MPQDSTRRRRQVCIDCQYPLLRLDDFEGTSSHDAPVAGNRNSDMSGDLRLDLVTFPWRLVRGIWRGGESQSRRRKVARLRADILPEAPDAKICPMCLHVFFPDELGA